MDIEDVEKLDLVPAFVVRDPPEVPGDQRLVSVDAAVRPELNASRDVLGGVLKRQPSPFRGTGNLGVRIRATDGGRIGDRFLEQFVVGRRIRVDVAVG